MKQAGQVVLSRFPQTDLAAGKFRPVLLLAQLPGDFEDWLTCMISSQTRHYLAEFDELLRETDADFAESGLKAPSVIRVSRLAVVQGELLPGAIGHITSERLLRIKRHLVDWLGPA